MTEYDAAERPREEADGEDSGGLEKLRGTSDAYNSIAAGTIAGLVFKSSGACARH